MTITQDIDAGTMMGIGIHTITLTTTDGADNEATCTVEVTIIDDTNPTSVVQDLEFDLNAITASS